jgi:hypothetical protein
MALGCVVVFELGCEFAARPATSHTSTTMGPPQDRDVAMGPPPPRLPSTQPPPPQATKDTPDVLEKYRKLKRRYFELEEVRRAPTCRSADAQRTRYQKHQETQAELRHSGERNVRLREEREYVPTLPIRWRVAQSNPASSYNEYTSSRPVRSQARPACPSRHPVRFRARSSPPGPVRPL